MGWKNVIIFLFDFGFERLIIFSYCTLICRHIVVNLSFLCLLTRALTAGNVRNTVEIFILTPCVFYTEYSILDIPIMLYLCNVDIKRAFDTVWHSALFVKLCNLGIRGKVWRIILDMYTSIESCVSLNRKLSSWFPVKQGVRQGSVLSTFLYLVFMNDLLDEIQNSRKGSCIGPTDSSCPAYVDDTVFLANSPNRLQDIVNIAFVYACKNHFEIHPEKTFVTIFGKRLKTINQSINIKLGERELPPKQSALHLGILKESSRSLNNTIKE